MTRSPFKIIVVGAGPAGLLLSLLLARHGISVTILDAAKELDNRPRATHYGTPAVYELRRAGVIDDVLAEGFLPGTMCWRKLDGTYLAGIDNTVLGDHPDRLVCLPLDRLGKILLRHLDRERTAEVKWNHRVKDIGQDDDKAWVKVTTPNGKVTMEADYIVGCDGASSQIRRSLHGDLVFPGTTWDERIVATNVYYDFHKYGYEDANFIIHPEHWHMASRISKDGMWRVSYGEKGGLTHDELIARQAMKFREMLPGNPSPKEYKLTNISPYRVHQRLAQRMREGRFLLAADAAHLCNPFGGLGLTGGIVDVGGLSDCLFGIWTNQANPDILDVYNQVRRRKYSDMVDPMSSQNLQRLFERDPESVLEPGQDELMTLLKKAENDVDFAKEMALSINDLKYDFTQHYMKPKGIVANM